MGELLVILVIVILVFGASRLPQLGDGLGKGIRSFKRAIASDDDIDVTPADKQVSSQPARTAREEVADAEVVEPSRPG